MSQSPLRFGRFDVLLDQRVLTIDGAPVALGSRAFDLLAALVERRERLVTKDELMKAVWPGVVVEENNLQVQVSTLRKLLGAQVIATVPGRGYRFTAVPAAAAPARPPAADAPATAPQLLVVDDNKVNRLLLARMLEQQGHRVVTVDSGGAALQRLRAERFELLLLDLEMPELDGFSVLERLAADAELHDLPVIVTSSVEGVAPVARCIELGADDFLHKPVNPVLLRARVGSTLEKRRLREQQKALIVRLSANAAAPDASGTDSTPPDGEARRGAATVLALKLRDFTPRAAERPADETLALLDSWFTLMHDAVVSQNGLVCRAGGDGLMAVFGLPLPAPLPGDAPLAAARAALEMLDMLEVFNHEGEAAGRPALAIDVGIASGEIVGGYVGRPRRAIYTCVGDAVDRALALQAEAPQHGHAVLVDAATQAALAGRVRTEPLPPRERRGAVLHAIAGG